MKKTYQTPEIEIYDAQTEQMLAASVGFGDPLEGGSAEALGFDDIIIDESF